eukprot:7189267-Lingulodinium_polyedra.AAC.1
MRGGGVLPDLISYNASIVACKSGRHWARALSLLHEMRCEALQPSVATHASALLVREGSSRASA